MLRLFATLKDHYLKVREAFPHEAFTSSFTWKDVLEIQYTPETKYMMSWPSLLPDLEPVRARALVELVAARYPVSTQYFELKKLCPELPFNNGADEWVFYGGSFNPWHQGHQACLNLLPNIKTCFILPDINPHKEAREFELVSTVLEISSRSRLNDHQYLVPTFLVDRAKNPTVNWIERLSQDFPGQKLSLLIGFDSFSKIKTWTRSDDLLPLLHCLYVVSRMESEQEREKATQEVLTLAPNLCIELLGRHGFEELSSTELRRRL